MGADCLRRVLGVRGLGVAGWNGRFFRQLHVANHHFLHHDGVGPKFPGDRFSGALAQLFTACRKYLTDRDLSNNMVSSFFCCRGRACPTRFLTAGPPEGTGRRGDCPYTLLNPGFATEDYLLASLDTAGRGEGWGCVPPAWHVERARKTPRNKSHSKSSASKTENTVTVTSPKNSLMLSMVFSSNPLLVLGLSSLLLCPLAFVLCARSSGSQCFAHHPARRTKGKGPRTTNNGPRTTDKSHLARQGD